MTYHLYMLVKEVTYIQLLDYEDMVRHDRRIPRSALTKCNYSSFKYLYSSGNDQALLNTTGNDHYSFDLLLSKFKILMITA